MVLLVGGLVAGGSLVAGCSGSEPEGLPAAFRDICTPERGCEFTDAVSQAACDELGNPARIMLHEGEHGIDSVVVFVTYPTVSAPVAPASVAPSVEPALDASDYPDIAPVVPRYLARAPTRSWNRSIDCTAIG